MTRRTIGRVMSPKRFSFVSTIEMVFGAMAGAMTDRSLSTRERLALRAANDAEQR